MTTPSRIVIIGAGLAGGSAALALREQGYDGELTIVGEETHRPYERPPLSKAILLGDAEEPDWVGETGFWTDSATLLSGTVATAIDRQQRVVTAGGRELPYDKLVLATGCAPRRLDIAGAELDNVLVLRTLDDALELRARFTEGADVVIVGAGWIGCEAAAAARKHGANVTMLDPLSAPLVRVLGDQVGGAFANLHREHGVDLRLGTGVTGFAGDGAVEEVRLAGGGSIAATTVLVGVGAIPNIALADAAGLELAAGGIAVDAALQTSDPDIYAVGDIAAHAHPYYAERVRVEHWANALEQGKHVAANLLGDSAPYELRPFFFSDQYDLGCEYRGLADPTKDRMVIRGDLEAREFTAFWLRDDAVAAALNVNQWDDGEALTELVESRRPVTIDDLVSGSL
ncbi:MAG TPA: FAD-dependent oxidoreductase [Microlunatus sp.]|nr:FAD-dependent oxidoreductase [Microlunatus sp.]